MTAGTVEKVYRLSDSRLTPVTGAVLAYYAYRAYYMDGRCAWPSLATVASACFCDEKTVRRALTRLCELGYMRVNPDQSWNARNPETGQLVRRGYRSKVYDVLIENFETLADEGRTERAREHAEHHRAEEPVNDARQTGQNVRSGKSGGNKVDIVSPRTGQNVHLPTSNQQSSPAPTGHPPTNRDEATDSGGRKQRSTTSLIRRQSVPESTAHDVGGGDRANDVLDALARMRSALGLETPEPTRRDRQAVGSLLERIRKRDTGGERALAEDEMLRVVAWMPSNTFWLRRVMTGRALAANWPDIVNDYAVDLIDKQRAYEAQTAERDKPQAERRPHQHTWLCSHVLAELGCTREQVQTDERLQEQALQIASRMNAGARERTSANTGAHPVREGGT